MRVVSVNVGLPREVQWKRMRVSTAIFKCPIDGTIPIRKLNLDGDRQADLTVHGGPSKAVYGYPVEHYDYWRSQLIHMPLGLGVFGENLTTHGLLEKDLYIGDRIRVGTAVLRVAQPRMPCYKLQIRFDRDDMTKLFAMSLRSGFYFAVIEEGQLTVGDPIEIIERDAHGISVAEVNGLYYAHSIDRDLLERTLNVPGLTSESRSAILSRVRALEAR